MNIAKFLVRIVSEHPLKAISLMFENETVGPCLFQKLNWEAMAPCLPPPTPLPSDYAPSESYILFLSHFTYKFTK